MVSLHSAPNSAGTAEDQANQVQVEQTDQTQAQQTQQTQQTQQAESTDTQTEIHKVEQPDTKQSVIEDTIEPAKPVQTIVGESSQLNGAAAAVSPVALEAAPVDTVVLGAAPVDAVAVEATPVDSVAVDTTPVDVVAVDATPVDAVAVETTPADTVILTATIETVDLHALSYDDLPDKRRVWPGAPGSREEGLGRLRLLTPDVVAAAAGSCIRTGRRVALNWELTKLDIANFNRAPTQHHIMSLLNGAGFDDVYIFNPQQSSQWDGLRHFSSPYPDSSQRLFYGGVTSGEIADRSNTRIGMQHWAQEGIVGRGVLLDYAEYARKHLPDLTYKTLSDHAIPLSVLQDVARDQRVTFERGDILFVRIGLTREWDTQMSAGDKLAYALSSNPQHAGVEGSEEMLRWIWDTGFAAVAGDAISFEVYPPKATHSRADGTSVGGLFMHEYLLPAWGMPVGELFDLEALSRMCIEHDRWTFFVTSAPLNMPGGVSSPPNCLAIF